jgi:hypothetical protein
LCLFFANHHPEFKLIFSDSEDDRFNRSKARNLGAKKAIEIGADIIIFNDADFFTEHKALSNAVKLAYQLQEVVIPYNTYCEHKKKIQTDILITYEGIYENRSEIKPICELLDIHTPKYLHLLDSSNRLRKTKDGKKKRLL